MREQRETIMQAAALKAIIHHWNIGADIVCGDIADRYLKARGLKGPWPSSLRLAPYRTTTSSDTALIAAAQRWPTDNLAAVQLTGLREPGLKAWRSPTRLTRGALAGAAVRLSAWEPGLPIVLVEGVEDGLAVVEAAPDAAVWAILGAANAPGVALPDGADVVLALDGDDAGRKAARSATEALWRRGHRVRVAELPAGRDPLDVLREAGQ